jgi:hypothetical protein
VLVCQRPRCLDGFPYELIEICRAGVEDDVPSIHLRSEEQVADDPQQAVGIPVDHGEVASLAVSQITRLAVEHELEVAANRGERRAKLMRHGRDEIVLHAVEPSKLVVLRPEPSDEADRTDRDPAAAGNRQDGSHDRGAVMAHDRESEGGNDGGHRDDAGERDVPLVREVHVPS